MKDKGLSEGYIKLYRKILHDPILMKDSVTFHLAGYLLLKANHRRNTFPFNRMPVTVERGQLITGRDQISSDTRIPSRQIRTRLELLKNIGFLTIKTTRRFSIITICNYDYYQDSCNEKRPNRRPSGDQVTTTNKNDKNEKNLKNIECNDFERLEAFLSSLLEYQSFSLEARELILEFVNKVREANKSKTIQGGRVCELVDQLRGIQDRAGPESLLIGLKKVFRKLEKDGFDFKRRDPTGYVRSVAESYKAGKNRDRLLRPSLEEGESLRNAQAGGAYQHLKNLINIKERSGGT